MFVRKLAKDERVDAYIDSMMQLHEDQVTLWHTIEEAELARLLLTNALEVFPDLSYKLVAAIMRDELELGKVRGRLLARAQEETMRGLLNNTREAKRSGDTSASVPDVKLAEQWRKWYTHTWR
ncbi:hypothetical protein V7S43_012382 [Phytophthora oleae]|uniref:Uncharacterized protein n=1 Tax=Phytophthora oleae TaxID=2107226 RepID=A0ABD3F993_9STRA